MHHRRCKSSASPSSCSANMTSLAHHIQSLLSHYSNEANHSLEYAKYWQRCLMAFKQRDHHLLPSPLPSPSLSTSSSSSSFDADDDSQTYLGLDLSSTHISHMVAVIFIDVMLDHQVFLGTLLSVNLSGCRIAETQLSNLIVALHQYAPNLTSLCLSSNDVKDMGAANLSAMLVSRSCRLQRLELKCCGMSR